MGLRAFFVGCLLLAWTEPASAEHGGARDTATEAVVAAASREDDAPALQLGLSGGMVAGSGTANVGAVVAADLFDHWAGFHVGWLDRVNLIESGGDRIFFGEMGLARSLPLGHAATVDLFFGAALARYQRREISNCLLCGKRIGSGDVWMAAGPSLRAALMKHLEAVSVGAFLGARTLYADRSTEWLVAFGGQIAMARFER